MNNCSFPLQFKNKFLIKSKIVQQKKTNASFNESRINMRNESLNVVFAHNPNIICENLHLGWNI